MFDKKLIVKAYKLITFVFMFSLSQTVFSQDASVLPNNNSNQHLKTSTKNEQAKNAYAESAIQGWKEIVFKGHTQYIKTETCIQAKSKNAASGLISETRRQVNADTVLRWGWTANKLLIKENKTSEKSKEGDDFLARVYVIHEGRFPWQTKAINYVWSNENPVDDHWPNPFLKNAHMIVVQSGESELGKFTYFERNVQADFKKYFDMDINRIDAIAIMTDTDNTKGEAEACYELPVFSEDNKKLSYRL